MFGFKSSKENDKQMMRLKAIQMGMFNTRAGIFDYYTTFEGLSEEEAAEKTDIVCKYRGVKDNPEEAKKALTSQIGEKLGNYIVKSLEEDPMKAISDFGNVIGGALSFGAGILTQKKISENETEDENIVVNNNIEPEPFDNEDGEELRATDI